MTNSIAVACRPRISTSLPASIVWTAFAHESQSHGYTKVRYAWTQECLIFISLMQVNSKHRWLYLRSTEELYPGPRRSHVNAVGNADHCRDRKCVRLLWSVPGVRYCDCSSVKINCLSRPLWVLLRAPSTTTSSRRIHNTWHKPFYTLCIRPEHRGLPLLTM